MGLLPWFNFFLIFIPAVANLLHSYCLQRTTIIFPFKMASDMQQNGGMDEWMDIDIDR